MAFDLVKLAERFVHPQSLESAAHAQVDKLMADTAQVLAELLPYGNEAELAINALVHAAEMAHAALDHRPSTKPLTSEPAPVPTVEAAPAPAQAPAAVPEAAARPQNAIAADPLPGDPPVA